MCLSCPLLNICPNHSTDRTMNSHAWRMVNLTNYSAFARFQDGELRSTVLTSPRQSGYYDVTSDYWKPINI